MRKLMKDKGRKKIQTGKADPDMIKSDVIKSEFEAYPGHLEELTERDELTDLEESVVRNSVDGKTWLSDREDRQ